MKERVPQALADDRRLVAGYLHDRLAGTTGRPVTVRVALLGAQNAMRRLDAPDTDTGTDPGTDTGTDTDTDTDTAGLLPVHVHGDAVLLGPFDSARPCFHCLARRWQQLRTGVEREALQGGPSLVAHHTSPFLSRFGLEAIWRTVQQIVRVPPERRHTDRHGHPFVHELRLRDLTVRRHPIVADSQCPRCAVPAEDSADAARITLRSQTKRSVDDFRISSAADHDLEFGAYANPVCGMAGTGAEPSMTSTTTANVKGRIDVPGGGYVHETFWAGHSDSYARSALLGILEAHERIAGTQPRRFSDPVVGTYRNLRDSALDPAECGLYTEEFYARSRHYTPYHPDLAIPWVWGYSLRDERPLLVPAAITYYHLIDQTGRFVQECSNGCASGGCLEEAILHGLLELVERDAFLIAWYAKPRLREIDPYSSTRVSSRLMTDRLSMYGYDLRLFDARIEFPIPVVIAVAQRRGGGVGRLLFGAGASLDPEEAIASGLYEVASAIPDFPGYTKLRADELTAKAADFSQVVSLSDHAPLYGLPEMAGYAAHLLGDGGRPAGLPPVEEVYRGWRHERPRTLDLLDDLRFCVQSVVEAGFDVIVVDQTSPEQAEIRLHTASVVIPGLLPVDFGWDRQRALHMTRTRTVLRRAGLRDSDLEASGLNRAPHPFQ
ncbi:ribosomal protein S12 methylthiotransferase accessory factor [Nonomuraea fuscirosea]|uniref:Ribosomal protein S12 methylthiotransferase accessory factor n=1 Tax=Nonomuraea fuscirosea TaxID=1291556 RepID=A0A2T0MQX0_9ACTN|nr:ribosomal protein S12 methylthiotransferase accessory factor [Nonomuraea fuscirosea]